MSLATGECTGGLSINFIYRGLSEGMLILPYAQSPTRPVRVILNKWEEPCSGFFLSLLFIFLSFFILFLAI